MKFNFFKILPVLTIFAFSIILCSCGDDGGIKPQPNPGTPGDTTTTDTPTNASMIYTFDENPDNDMYLGYVRSKLTEVTSNFGVTFTIQNESETNAFRVNEEGFLYVNQGSAFDYEASPTVTAKVVASKNDVEEVVDVIVHLEDTYEPAFQKVTVNGEGFPIRHGHEVVVFKNQLYVIGGYLGYNTGEMDSSVWVSDDAVNWTQLAAGFSPRQFFSAVVFNDKLWVIGGRDKNNDNLNDIWYTSDGINWTEANVTGDIFSPREGHSVNVFNNQLVLTGGYNLPNNTRIAEVWTSPDGINWSNSTPAENMFTKRGDHTAVVFNNQLVLMGGDEAGNYTDNIWVSDDAISWTEVTPDTDHFPHIGGATAVVFKDRVWHIGGYNSNGYNGEVWSTTDLYDWTYEVPVTMYDPYRFDHQSVVFNDRVYVIGGYGTGSNLLNDIWYFE